MFSIRRVSLDLLTLIIVCSVFAFRPELNKMCSNIIYILCSMLMILYKMLFGMCRKYQLWLPIITIKLIVCIRCSIAKYFYLTVAALWMYQLTLLCLFLFYFHFRSFVRTLFLVHFSDFHAQRSRNTMLLCGYINNSLLNL